MLFNLNNRKRVINLTIRIRNNNFSSVFTLSGTLSDLHHAVELSWLWKTSPVSVAIFAAPGEFDVAFILKMLPKS